MRDRRRVDELSIEELEQVLALRKREERQKRLTRMQRQGRVIASASTPTHGDNATTPPQEPNPDTVMLLDGEAAEDLPIPTKKSNRLAKRAMNNLLLLVEAAAVLGLFYLGYQLIEGIDILEQESAEAQIAADEARARTVPTIEPTPMLALNQVVLPGGHKWVEGQTPSLNIEEIPENVRFAVADQITQPVLSRPPATDDTALAINIPKLGVEQTIVQGSDWEALKQGVGQVLNGYDPGDETGNVALTAHNDIYGELFKDLDQLQPGDQFQIQTRGEVHLYEVTGMDVVNPTDVHVLLSQGRATATLISCYPYRVNTQRIVVFADRIG